MKVLWIALMATMHCVMYYVTYVIRGKVDDTLYAEITCNPEGDSDVACVDCEALPVPTWAVYMQIFQPDAFFLILTIAVFAIVLYARTEFGFFNKAKNVSWASHRKYFVNPISIYVGIIVLIRCAVEAVKLLFNQEQMITMSVSPATALAIKSCVKKDFLEEASDDVCPLFLNDIDKVRPGGGGAGLSGIHPILTNHSIRNSFIHAIIIIVVGVGHYVLYMALKSIGDWLNVNIY